MNSLLRALTNSKDGLVLFDVFGCEGRAHADGEWRQRQPWQESCQQEFEVNFMQEWIP